MANPYKGLTVELDGNVTDFSRALRQAKNEAKGTVSELREIKKALKFDPQNAEQLAKAQANYQKQIQATEKELEILRKKEKEIKDSGEDISVEAWTKLQNEIQKASDKLARLKQESTNLQFAGPIEEARKQVQGAEKDLSRLNQSLKLDPSNIELLTLKQEALESALEGSVKQAESLRQKAKEIGRENMSTTEWINLQGEISDCEAKARDFEEELKNLSRTTDTETDKMKSSVSGLGDKIQNAGQKISGVGDAYTQNVSLPIVAAAAASVKAATDIDTSLTDVKKTVDGTEEEYQALKQAAIDYSQVNAVSPSEILSLQALGAQLGFGKDQLKEFAEVASGLDISTNMDAEQAASEMAHFKNIVGDTNFEMDRYASTIVELGNHTATTERDISEMAQRIAGAGKSVGLSNAEILGMSAALSSLGLEAEAGGSAISTIMSNVDMAVAQGTQGVKKYADAVGMSTDDFVRALSEDASQFEEFAKANGTTAEQLQNDILNNISTLSTWAEAAGMTAEEFAAKWQDKPVEAFQDLLKGIQTSTDQGGNLSLLLDSLGISSIRQLDSMKRLVNSGDLLVDTVDLANKGWQENTALGKEVANRNESLASKFEILKNRVTAVADDVGGPLADALLDAIDAAEPLFKAVADGAKAFSSMSKEEQLSIIQTVGMVAAIGPLLSAVGRLTGGIGGAMKVLGNFGSAIGDLGSSGKTTKSVQKGLKIVTDDMGKVEKAAGGATKAASGLAGAGGLGGLIAVAGLVVAAFAIEKWQEYQREIELTKDATRDLADLQAEAAGKVDDYGSHVDELAKKAHDMKQAMSDANREFVETLRDADVQIGTAQQYGAIIEDLTKKEKLTADEQLKLKDAVEKFNEITGDSIEVVDAENGKLNESIGVIKNNTQAWLDNLKIKAYQDEATEAMKRMVDAQFNLEDAQKSYKETSKEYNDALAEQAKALAEGNIPKFFELSQKVAELGKDMETSRQAVVDFDAEMQTNKKRVDDCTKASQDLQAAHDDEQRKLHELYDAVVQYGDGTVQKFNEMQIPVEDFAVKLQESGLSAQDLRRVSKEQFDQMLNECGTDVDAMIAWLKQYNGYNIDPKVAKITGDTTGVETAFDKIKKDIESRKITVKMEGYMKNANQTIYGGLTRQNASGGLFQSANILNSIPRHADGFIADQPMLTSVGWAFEAGSEALIPLDNKQKVAPFAKAVASFMPAGGDTYLVIDGAVVNSNPQIKQTFLDLFEDIYRMGGMNRG